MLEFLGHRTGQTLQEETVKAGLRELCPGIHFDLAGCLTSQTGIHPYIENRQGVYYEGRHIGPMDRGQLPEWDQWSVKEYLLPVEWSQADDEDARIRFVTVPTTDPCYPDWKALAIQGGDPGVVLWNGKVCLCVPVKPVKRPETCIWVGWRYTFEALIAANLPGITRESLSRKFRIDMTRKDGPAEMERGVELAVN